MYIIKTVTIKSRFPYAKYKVKAYFPSKIWAILAHLIASKQKEKYEERIEANKTGTIDRKVYIIRRRPPGGGLFSNVNHVLQGIEVAKARGLVPYVDMKNYWTSYSQREPFRDVNNAWQYFFEPVSELTLNLALSSRTIVYSAGDRINNNSLLSDRSLKFVLDPEAIDYLHTLYTNTIKLNSLSIELIANVKSFLNWTPDTLGVFYRGTDYLSLMPSGHARQPSIERMQIEISNKLQESSFRNIFLSTEDLQVRELLSAISPEMTYPDFRELEVMRTLLPSGEKASSQVMNAFGYLAEIYLLSEARSIVASIANGSATAIILNGNRYENPVVINVGTY